MGQKCCQKIQPHEFTNNSAGTKTNCNTTLNNMTLDPWFREHSKLLWESNQASGQGIKVPVTTGYTVTVVDLGFLCANWMIKAQTVI